MQVPTDPSANRLQFDQFTLSVFLDGRKYAIQKPRTFELYCFIATRYFASRRQISQAAIRAELLGFRGQKTIRRILDTLPAELRRTVRSDPNGFWVVLPDCKDCPRLAPVWSWSVRPTAG